MAHLRKEKLLALQFKVQNVHFVFFTILRAAGATRTMAKDKAKSRKEECAPPSLLDGELINAKWLVQKKLGEGGFGAVYQVKHVITQDIYAMKVESNGDFVKVLKVEVQVLKEITKRGCRHAPIIVDRARKDRYDYVVMTLLGESLSSLRRTYPDRKFTLCTAVRVGIQCLESLEDLHRIGYLHRDVKPGNFAIGRKELKQNRTIFVLDFGLARLYINEDTGEIRAPRMKAGFRGTLRYAPLACHYNKDMCRRDDLETWFYQQIEISVGKLPWGTCANNENSKVKEMKETSRTDGSLCRGCPPEYGEIIAYIDSLTYWNQPDYNKIYTLLRKLMTKLGYKDEDPYDWEEPESTHNTEHTQKTSSKAPVKLPPRPTST